MHKLILLTLIPLFAIVLKPAEAFSQAVIDFDTTHYTVEAGQAISICLNVKNANFSTNNYEIELFFNGSSLPHFIEQQYRKIDLKSQTYCFELQTIKPILHDSETIYFFSVNPTNTSVLVAGQTNPIEIKVLNYPEPTNLGPKELMFIGYDNEISTSGTDKIVLFNAVPISNGTSFTLTNALPFDSTGVFYTPFYDSLLTSYSITYIGQNTIPPFSKLSFQIIRNIGTGPLETLGNFAINSNPSSNFEVENISPNSHSSLNIDGSSNSALSLIYGDLNWTSGSNYFLSGNLIDGMIFTPDTNYILPEEILNIVNVTLSGSTYGLIRCNGDVYLCDLVESAGHANGWFFSIGNVSDNLNTSTILDTCDINECSPFAATIVPLSPSDSIDMIFLVDNSRSIVAFHFDEMKESIANLIENISAVAPNTRFAITQFADVNDFEVTIPFTFDAEEAGNFIRAFNGDSYIGEAVEKVMDEILYGDLSLRENIILQFLIYTDAIGWKFLTLGYDPYNTVKLPPFESITSTIRYSDWPLDNPIAASTTSLGGNYYGALDPNPADPDGIQLPRRYYNPTEFDDPLNDLLADIIQYNFLQGNIEYGCENPNYEWLAFSGGEIVSNNGTLIETNGLGSYILNISCDGGCVFSDTFNYNTLLPYVIPPIENKNTSNNYLKHNIAENQDTTRNVVKD